MREFDVDAELQPRGNYSGRRQIRIKVPAINEESAKPIAIETLSPLIAFDVEIVIISVKEAGVSPVVSFMRNLKVSAIENTTRERQIEHIKGQHEYTEPKYKKGEDVLIIGWNKQLTGSITDMGWIYDGRQKTYTWGYRIKYEKLEPGVPLNYVPEEFLRKIGEEISRAI